MQKSPVQSLVDTFQFIKGESPIYLSPDQKSAELKTYQDSISRLSKEIYRLENLSPYRKAIVNTEANSLNLRANNNISSDVVIKIPDSSMVEVIYFDEEVLVLEGETGKWCKIRYADKEGWVWGNYVTLVD